MGRFSEVRLGWTQRANTAVDSLLYALSVYGVPVLIGAMSLFALVAWDSQYLTDGNTPLAIRVIQSADRLEPGQAAAQLVHSPLVRHYDTKLSEAAFWFT